MASLHVYLCWKISIKKKHGNFYCGLNLYIYVKISLKKHGICFLFIYIGKFPLKKNTNIVFVAYIHVHDCIFMSENFPLKTWKLFTCIFMLKAFQNIT